MAKSATTKSSTKAAPAAMSQQMKAAKGFVYISPKPASAKAAQAIVDSMIKVKPKAKAGAGIKVTPKIKVNPKAEVKTTPKIKVEPKVTPAAKVIVKGSRAQVQQEKKAAAVSAIVVELDTSMKYIKSWARRMKMGQEVQRELSDETWIAMIRVQALFALIRK